MPGMVGGASDQVTCRDHALELEKYCITCSEPICTRCASSKHNNHVTEDTRRTANERRIELQSLVTDSNIRRQIKGTEDHIRATRQDRAKLETDITLTVKAIQSHIKCIKDELDATGDKLIGDLKDKRTQWLANMDTNITEFVSNQKATHAVVANTQLIVERARDIELLAKYPDIKAAITDTKTSRHPSFGQIMKVDFIPLSVNTACGRVDVKASLKRPLEMYEVGSALIQKHPTSICPTNNGKAWVAHRKCIQVVNRDGGMGTRIDLMEPVLCVSQNSRGKIYMACPSSVKCINSRSEPKQCFSLLHQASDMTFTESDDLLICFKDARRISMFDVKGKLIKELDARGFTYIYGTRITDPWNVAINDNTHDIYVSDYSSENIAVFDQKGDIKSSFRCNVHRHAMLSCHRGLLYIADNRRDCVHVLSESGQLLQTCSTAGISGPWSIAVDTAGLLWLGFWAGNLKIYTIR